ncbi:MAG: phospholipase D family protein, partial [Dehalococcoidia bacterium]
MFQPELFIASESFRSVVISKRKDFDALFDGFTKLRAISYVLSPDLLLDFLDKRGYKEVEVLVGENLSESYRQGLAQKNRHVTERLVELVETGVLRIFVPRATIHTKLYILEGSGLTRVILTSANLTKTAQEATRQ